MVFTEPTFLFILLPLALGINAFAGQRLRNLLLLGLSLLFYFMGERAFVLLMLLSCLMNYGFGLGIERSRPTRHAGRVLALAVGSNLALLGLFKYTGFVLGSLDAISGRLGGPAVPVTHLPLPIGISFFTFQAISYLVDVYRGVVPAERKWWNLALYISLFPQLIAGPIVRYSQLASELHRRTIRSDRFALGAERFILGLAKKTILANTLAVAADGIFGLAPDQLSTPLAWIGLLAYTFQIYYDFSGYSDMAIGIGMMLGFRFPENFNYPYISRSMTEFWRRWHISLSTWFRDYLYIPLGGNRKGNRRTAINLLIVFFLCGLWHGAGWNFVIWGLFHGVFLMVERLPLLKTRLAGSSPVAWLYALPVILLSWVFFRCETLADSGRFIAALLGRSGSSAPSPALYLDGLTLTVFAAALVFATPVYPALRRRLAGATGYEAAYVTALFALLLLCLTQVAAGTYDPFIYFRF